MSPFTTQFVLEKVADFQSCGALETVEPAPGPTGPRVVRPRPTVCLSHLSPLLPDLRACFLTQDPSPANASAPALTPPGIV